MTSGYKGTKQGWWDKELEDLDLENARKALVNHIIDEELTKEELTPDIDTVKDVLPKMKKLDERWKSVQTRAFSITEHKAHRHFYDTICNLIGTKNKLPKLL